MEMLLGFIWFSLCTFGILMVLGCREEAIVLGPSVLLIGLISTVVWDTKNDLEAWGGEPGESINAASVPNSPMIQDVELFMSEPMAVVAQIARAEQGEMNYVLRENIGMPAISYHKSSNPPLTEEALPVTTPTKPLDTPNTEINNSEHSFYGFEFSRVLNTVLVLFAVTIIALGFWVFNLRTNLELLTLHSARSTQYCEALIDRLENKLSTLETDLAMSQMYSGPAADVPVEKSNLSVHDGESSVLKMRRRLELD